VAVAVFVPVLPPPPLIRQQRKATREAIRLNELVAYAITKSYKLQTILLLYRRSVNVSGTHCMTSRVFVTVLVCYATSTSAYDRHGRWQFKIHRSASSTNSPASRRNFTVDSTRPTHRRTSSVVYCGQSWPREKQDNAYTRASLLPSTMQMRWCFHASD